MIYYKYTTNIFSKNVKCGSVSIHFRLEIHYISYNYFCTVNFKSIDTNIHKFTKKQQEIKLFNEWLSGLIDGAGCFQLSKKGYASLEITMELRDKHCLFKIKNKFGGSVKVKQGNNWLRYRLHHKIGLLNLIYAVNGLIRNPNRLLQFDKICDKYNINLLYPEPLTYNNGWLAGFIDADGSISVNISTVQIFITASQKNKLLLDPLINLYGGIISIMGKIQAFKWTILKKNETLNLLNYFKNYPLLSKKMVRIRLIIDVYKAFQMAYHKAEPNTINGKIWLRLIKKWETYTL